MVVPERRVHLERLGEQQQSAILVSCVPAAQRHVDDAETGPLECPIDRGVDPRVGVDAPEPADPDLVTPVDHIDHEPGLEQCQTGSHPGDITGQRADRVHRGCQRTGPGHRDAPERRLRSHDPATRGRIAHRACRVGPQRHICGAGGHGDRRSRRRPTRDPGRVQGVLRCSEVGVHAGHTEAQLVQVGLAHDARARRPCAEETGGVLARRFGRFGHGRAAGSGDDAGHVDAVLDRQSEARSGRRVAAGDEDVLAGGITDATTRRGAHSSTSSKATACSTPSRGPSASAREVRNMSAGGQSSPRPAMY